MSSSSLTRPKIFQNVAQGMMLQNHAEQQPPPLRDGPDFTQSLLTKHATSQPIGSPAKKVPSYDLKINNQASSQNSQQQIHQQSFSPKTDKNRSRMRENNQHSLASGRARQSLLSSAGREHIRQRSNEESEDKNNNNNFVRQRMEQNGENLQNKIKALSLLDKKVQLKNKSQSTKMSLPEPILLPKLQVGHLQALTKPRDTLLIHQKVAGNSNALKKSIDSVVIKDANQIETNQSIEGTISESKAGPSNNDDLIQKKNTNAIKLNSNHPYIDVASSADKKVLSHQKQNILTEESSLVHGAGNNANPFLTHAKFAPSKFDEQITFQFLQTTNQKRDTSSAMQSSINQKKPGQKGVFITPQLGGSNNKHAQNSNNKIVPSSHQVGTINLNADYEDHRQLQESPAPFDLERAVEGKVFQTASDGKRSNDNQLCNLDGGDEDNIYLRNQEKLHKTAEQCKNHAKKDISASNKMFAATESYKISIKDDHDEIGQQNKKHQQEPLMIITDQSNNNLTPAKIAVQPLSQTLSPSVILANESKTPKVDKQADGSFHKQLLASQGGGNNQQQSFSTMSLQPYVRNQNDENSKFSRMQAEILKYSDSPLNSLAGKKMIGSITNAQTSFVNMRQSNTNDNSVQQLFDGLKDPLTNQDGSLIEEEMTFEELSSKLGQINHCGSSEDFDMNNFNRMSAFQTNNLNPFSEINTSAHISQRTPNDSLNTSKAQSLDFNNLPALLQTSLDVHQMPGDFDLQAMRPKFEYEGRMFSHFNVNKMTFENQAFATINRGSFAENIGDKARLPDYTGDSENISPIHPKNFDRQYSATQLVSPNKDRDCQVLIKGLETPNERSDLYDNFDINHEVASTGSQPNSGGGFIEEAMKSMDTQRTNLSDNHTGRALIPETGIETRAYHSRHISNPDNNQALTRKFSRKRMFDLTKDVKQNVSERLVQILDLGMAGSTIKLPAKEIEMPSIVIKKPFKIIGQPGTALDFKASTLVIDISSEHQDKGGDFRNLEPLVFSEIQFQFTIDLRQYAYSKYATKQNGGVGGHSHNSKSSKMVHHQIQSSRSLVQLIEIKNGAKAEFRDCSFKCVKIFQQRRLGTASSNQGGGQSHNNIQRRIRTDRSHSQHQVKELKTTAQRLAEQNNNNSNRQDSISVGPSEKQFNDSASMGGQYVGANTSGRILGRYFANEKEEENILRENVHEICFWMNAEAMNEHPSCLHEFTKNQRYNQPSGGGGKVRRKTPYQASLLLQSCVFTGFYNQIRAGCNATIEVDKCYMQESVSSAIMLVNPCYFRMVESNLIRTQINSGVNIRWLSDSIDKHTSRVIDIQQNDFGFNQYCGIEIQGNAYSAHNLKIDISKNCIYRNKKEGLLIQNLAVTAILLYGNEFSKNESDNLKIQHVHQKGNKRYAFRLENCQIDHSKGGFGAHLYDTSFIVKNCIVKGNQSGGLFCSCPEKPQTLLQDALFFLKKFPMSIKITNCEITQNMHYGVLVQDFWKGSVIIKNSLVQYNCNFGIYIHAKEPPKEKVNRNQTNNFQQLSLNHNLLSVQQEKDDVSAVLFKNMNTQQTTARKAILGFSTTSPQTQQNHFNVSSNSQQPGLMQSQKLNPNRRRQSGKMTHVINSLKKAQSSINLNSNQNIMTANNGNTISTVRDPPNNHLMSTNDKRNSMQLLNLQRVQSQTRPSQGKIHINEGLESGQTTPVLQQQDQIMQLHPTITDRINTHTPKDIEEENNQMHTGRNLLTTHSDNMPSLMNNFRGPSSLLRNQSAAVVDQMQDDQSRINKESPAIKQQSTSLASSIMASFKRKTGYNNQTTTLNNRNDSFVRNKRSSFLGGSVMESAGQIEMSKQLTAQILHQIDVRLVMERQELGKVYIVMGTGVIKNGGAGIAVRHCYLEIDDNPKTRVQDNDFGYQVYVMLKQCQRLLTGFEQAMIENRISGRKVLVGGGWGQITPIMPARCCSGVFKPCVLYFKRCCGGRDDVTARQARVVNNKVMDNPGITMPSQNQETNYNATPNKEKPAAAQANDQNHHRKNADAAQTDNNNTAKKSQEKTKDKGFQNESEKPQQKCAIF